MNMAKLKKVQISILAAFLLLGVVTSVVYAAGGGGTVSAVLKDLAAVRSATARYHDVNVAMADGYIPTETCTAAPGLGAMGYHYVNVSRIGDQVIDLAAPEILLYAQVGGKLRLVGVEYFLGIGEPDNPVPNPAPPAPVLFGRSFGDPMPGHEPGMPPHYDLHVWVWQPNPSGMFAPFNPGVECP